jgi:hypothetical protein
MSVRLSSRQGLTFVLVLAGVLAMGQGLQAATLTVVNNCGATVYPGIYPPVYQNGGWSQAAGTSVSFTIASGWIGRVWGRTGCNSSSPAQCTSGSCGWTGLQCAGTTGYPNTSLFEANINASGTDWYDVSYVDAVDNPIGLSVTNGACVSPNACSSAVITNCPADLRSGNICLSPCSRYNTDQYCCRGAYGTASTCIVSQWAASAQQYVNNIHAYCPREYAYAYDEVAGGALQTCPTGINYTVTFCPSGGSQPTPTATAQATPTPTTAPSATPGATPTATPRPTATATSGGSTTWQAGVYYAVGTVVTYNGVSYRCLQAHTSLAGWEPPNVPALWTPV